MSENTTGSGSGLKQAKVWNFGFMAGVRQLRDEEYEDQYKPSLKPPGSTNFLRVAQEQFNMEEKAIGSGYMAEEPGNTPAWRRVPEHLVKLRLPRLLYDGTAEQDPNDSYENGITGQWSAKMRKHGQVGKAPLPGYDGAVSGFYAPGGGNEDAPEGEHEVATVEGSAEGLALAEAKAKEAQRKGALREKLKASEATLRLASAIAKGAKSVTSGSDPGSASQGTGTTAQDPKAGSAGWEVGSQNHSNLLALKSALMSWGSKAKASKAKKRGAE